mmetsp:Transcript_19796/g.43281  ORF Transcript_19796/g.43281 Transcript_19796/m.43281 type:complete len:120 (-) Transcript_19796:362-721(-)
MHPKLIAERNSSQSESEPEFFDEAEEEEEAELERESEQAVSALLEARRGKRTFVDANLEAGESEQNTTESAAEAKLKALKYAPSKISGVAPKRAPRVGKEYQATLPELRPKKPVFTKDA